MSLCHYEEPVTYLPANLPPCLLYSCCLQDAAETTKDKSSSSKGLSTLESC